MTEIAVGPGDRSSTVHAPAGAYPPAERAVRSMAAVDRATRRLRDVADDLNEAAVHQPSLLPGWSRAHVLSHLARDADGCVNLLRWARTGVEHPMYASGADRDADIEEGAMRGHLVLLEDLIASAERLRAAAQALPEPAWSTEVVGPLGRPVPASEVPAWRLLEVWTHLVDLDHGFGFDDIPSVDAERLLEDAVQQYGGRPDVPAVTVSVDFGDHQRSWNLRGTTCRPSQVHGTPGAVLGWLLGRSRGERLTGEEVPALPPWP